MTVDLRLGDCLEVMQEMPKNSIDTIITDPPYGLEFMGKDWDHGIPGIPFWQEALRIAKPGAHLLAFGGTRTFHRLACAIEDAGWEIRDTVMWIYGSGLPKSHNISKAIDKAEGAEREVIGPRVDTDGRARCQEPHACKIYEHIYGQEWRTAEQIKVITAPATPAAKDWQGWGTALKPAFEPITVAMKPLDGTFAANALKHGVAGINVDGCRVECNDKAMFPVGVVSTTETIYGGGKGRYANRQRTNDLSPQGRWPANLLHDGSDEVLAGFPVSNHIEKRKHYTEQKRTNGSFKTGFKKLTGALYGDTGSAARFFYCAKASQSERGNGNNHPTVKPLALMEYLCKLTSTPTGGVVLDPFMGSGTTGVACVQTGRNFIGIEIDPGYFEIAEKRIKEAQDTAKAAAGRGLTCGEDVV